MNIIIAKFGGTSVADEKARGFAIERVKSLCAQGFGVVAVVSAMGRKGAPYATDTLLSLIRPASGGESGASSPRARDLLMSCGETISACVFADSLEQAGVPACPMNGFTAGIATDGVYNAANITGMDASRVKAALEAGLVPVITGFQGISKGLEVTTLGRGGSDTSAVEIGGYLGAQGVIIYTDVPGVAEADPRIVPEARFLSETDAQDMLALAENGAGVIHPRAVRALMRFNIPVWVRSTFDDAPGTLLRPMAEKPRGLVGLAVKKGDMPEEEVVSALARPIPMALLQQAKDALPHADISVEGDLLRARVPENAAAQTVRTLYGLLR